jgi:hypothetical protein
MARRLGGGKAGCTVGWFFPEGLGTGRRKLRTVVETTGETTVFSPGPAGRDAISYV